MPDAKFVYDLRNTSFDQLDAFLQSHGSADVYAKRKGDQIVLFARENGHAGGSRARVTAEDRALAKQVLYDSASMAFGQNAIDHLMTRKGGRLAQFMFDSGAYQNGGGLATISREAALAAKALANDNKFDNSGEHDMRMLDAKFDIVDVRKLDKNGRDADGGDEPSVKSDKPKPLRFKYQRKDEDKRGKKDAIAGDIDIAPFHGLDFKPKPKKLDEAAERQWNEFFDGAALSENGVGGDVDDLNDIDDEMEALYDAAPLPQVNDDADDDVVNEMNEAMSEVLGWNPGTDAASNGDFDDDVNEILGWAATHEDEPLEVGGDDGGGPQKELDPLGGMPVKNLGLIDGSADEARPEPNASPKTHVEAPRGQNPQSNSNSISSNDDGAELDPLGGLPIRKGQHGSDGVVAPMVQQPFRQNVSVPDAVAPKPPVEPKSPRKDGADPNEDKPVAQVPVSGPGKKNKLNWREEMAKAGAKIRENRDLVHSDPKLASIKDRKNYQLGVLDHNRRKVGGYGKAFLASLHKQNGKFDPLLAAKGKTFRYKDGKVPARMQHIAQKAIENALRDYPEPLSFDGSDRNLRHSIAMWALQSWIKG